MTFTQFKNKLKKFLHQILGVLPSALPVGVSEFNEFVDSIINLYNPPCDKRSVRFIVATLIMRLNPTEAYKSKLYFALSIHRGAAGQISAHIMEQIKQEQAAEQQAALKKQQEEATSQQEEAASSGNKPVQN